MKFIKIIIYVVFFATTFFLIKCSKKETIIDEEKTGGYIPDTFIQIDQTPVIASQGFDLNNVIKTIDFRGKPFRNEDSDNDGIINKNDLCPTQPETYNGYLDTDGCPDTIIIVSPPPPSPETGVIIKMPTPINQGAEGSCVAMAVGYAARSVDWYYRTGATSYNNSVNVFSPEFVYNLSTFSTTECGRGTSMQTALDVMVNKGVSTFASMPYSSTNGCSLLPTSTQFAEALNYKISGYSKIAFTDRNAIRAMIDQKRAVIITVLADNSFINAKPGFVWKVYSGSGMLAHCIVICGYDDTKNVYKVMNSWGTDWADGGFSFIDYNFFETGGRTAGAGYVYVIN